MMLQHSVWQGQDGAAALFQLTARDEQQQQHNSTTEGLPLLLLLLQGAELSNKSAPPSTASRQHATRMIRTAPQRMILRAPPVNYCRTNICVPGHTADRDLSLLQCSDPSLGQTEQLAHEPQAQLHTATPPASPATVLMKHRAVARPQHQ
eukprot:GHRQ01036008.1.p1 GENE.GHRQ01036008.1~~GHRQ01036008.1.p1  ORF type:complete len:150 (-),score=33.79 GHRQ01036008.1:720-1169(-)